MLRFRIIRSRAALPTHQASWLHVDPPLRVDRRDERGTGRGVRAGARSCPFVERHLDALERKRLIERVGTNGFRFSRALIRLAAYESVARDDRARSHDRSVGWLERESPDLPAGLDEIIGHLEPAHSPRETS